MKARKLVLKVGLPCAVGGFLLLAVGIPALVGFANGLACVRLVDFAWDVWKARRVRA